MHIVPKINHLWVRVGRTLLAAVHTREKIVELLYPLYMYRYTIFDWTYRRFDTPAVCA